PAGGPAGARRRPQGRARPSRAPQPLPREPRRGVRPVPQGARARDEPGPALEARPRAVPRGREIADQGAGFALPGLGDRGRDLGDDLTMSDESTTVTLSRKDFQTDQEVRWCPGCGDYSILAA